MKNYLKKRFQCSRFIETKNSNYNQKLIHIIDIAIVRFLRWLHISDSNILFINNLFVKLLSESSNELMEEGIRGKPLQELIEGSFEKPIELQEDIVVASESMDVIQEQTYVPVPPSQPQIQTEKL